MATILQQIHPRRWVNGLWRNPDFVKLWGSLTITHFGGQVTFLALPLTAALMLNATPFEVGILTALEAHAKIGISDSAAQLVGPGIAGALIQWLTAPFAILLDALSFLVSALMLRGIPPAATDAPKARPRRMIVEIREGLAVVWHNPTL